MDCEESPRSGSFWLGESGTAGPPIDPYFWISAESGSAGTGGGTAGIEPYLRSSPESVRGLRRRHRHERRARHGRDRQRDGDERRDPRAGAMPGAPFGADGWRCRWRIGESWDGAKIPADRSSSNEGQFRWHVHARRGPERNPRRRRPRRPRGPSRTASDKAPSRSFYPLRRSRSGAHGRRRRQGCNEACRPCRGPDRHASCDAGADRERRRRRKETYWASRESRRFRRPSAPPISFRCAIRCR